MTLSNHATVFRLYDENGTHVLSILQCLDDDRGEVLDIATPGGKVLFCGAQDAMPSIIDHLPQEGVRNLDIIT